MLASGGTSTGDPALTRDTTVSPTPPAFGRFRVVHQVGAGVHGPVFLGTDPSGDRQVAIKTYPLDITPERAASLAAALERLVSVPLGHPSIVPLLAAGSEGSTVYLVQEYVLAESVDAAIRQYGPAPVPDALRLIGQLAGALDFAAVAGVHHGALHPRDVLVAPNEVRLTGLGVAEAFEQVGLRLTARRPYAAPERQERESWGSPADVFSLAAVGFEMLTGRRPGSAEALAADTRSVPSPDPPALAEAFARALSPRPSDRFQTALGFAAALRHALTGEPIERPDVAPIVAAAPAIAAAPREAVPLPPEPADPEPVHPGPVDPETAPELALPVPEREPDPEPRAGAEPVPAADPVRAAEPLPSPEDVPPELAVFAPGPVEAEPARPAGSEWEGGPLAEPAGAFEAEPIEGVEAEGAGGAPAAIDEFRGDDELAPEEAPLGPSELGEETGAVVEPAEPVADGDAVESPGPVEPADAAPLLPLEMGPEPPRVEEPRRPLPPPAPDVPAFRRPPPEPRLEPAAFRRPPSPPRLRFPLSSLLAMLLLGILAGFVGGYVVGRREPGSVGRSPQAEAAVRAEDAAPRADAPPTAVDRPEPAGPANGASATPRDPAARAQDAGAPAPEPPAAAPRAVVPAPPSRAAVARPQPRETPSRAAARRAAPAARDEDAAEGRFEAPLSVLSRPEGAVVRLDGRAVGKTPLQLRAVGAGAHVVRLELAGYLPWTSAIQVVSGTQNRVTASLERRPGSRE